MGGVNASMNCDVSHAFRFHPLCAAEDSIATSYQLSTINYQLPRRDGLLIVHHDACDEGDRQQVCRDCHEAYPVITDDLPRRILRGDESRQGRRQSAGKLLRG